MATITTTFQFKRGLASAWTNVNPILAAAEPGYELDTGKLKIGDGSTAWNDLDYLSGESFSISPDGLSIILNKLGEISLAGFEEAAAGQLLRKTEDGRLEWFIPTINDLEQTETIYLFGGSATEVL
jgi:hypothetical protein